ncbi:ankycorbin-like isoform X2 [Adelges cooleyi]|uniref:ankycorbin-like isoform X2 n=1 Tax=Adelges cooleyi TaxID=133065 RepID=UPI00218034C6|nr:ankycorbin-like isoform X2 [Adelges cooleyi]
MKKMLKLVKGGKREDKSGANTPSGDELEDELDSTMYCYKIDSEAEDKMSRLHRAAWHGSLEKVKTLLQKKPTDVNVVDSFGRTPLHLAMAKGYYNIAWLLLNHNANLECIDCDGYTPFLKVGESVLHVACSTENRDLIEFILDNGAFVNILDKQGRTPLMLAAKLGNMSIVDLLLERGSQLDTHDIHGYTAKEYASKEGYSKVVNQLSMQKMSIMARTRSKENFLDDLDKVEEIPIKENQQSSEIKKDNTFSEEKITKSYEPDSISPKETSINVLQKEETLNVSGGQNEVIQNYLIVNKEENFLNDSSNEKERLLSDIILPSKDEESVSQCTMPPPMDPPRSWDFIQASIKQTDDSNDKTQKEIQENIVQIPEPIVCPVNTDDSELEWGSNESLPTDPNQSCPDIDMKKDNKKTNAFLNLIAAKTLMSKNKNKVSTSADNIIKSTSPTTRKHVRNKSTTSLGTIKLTVPSEVNEALHQLSPEMNFAHTSFGKSKSFTEHITIENLENNNGEFERSKSLCLELKNTNEVLENQQKDSDSQSDDSLRSKRSLLLSMRMPKVHDEHHDEVQLEVKDSETSEEEGPHYWYSPNKRRDKIVQQDTVIRNNSKSDDSDSEEINLPKSKSTPGELSKTRITDDSDSENTISFSTSHEDIYGTHKRTRYALKRTESLKAYLKRVTIDKDKLQQETAGYKEITELLKYKLENLKQEISSQNEITKRLENQLEELDTKYTEALNRIQTLELSTKNLDKENQYLKQINNELTSQLDYKSEHKDQTTLKGDNIATESDLDEQIQLASNAHKTESTEIILNLKKLLKMEQDRRMELDEKIKHLTNEVGAHQSCGPSLELLKEMQHKMFKDYVPKKEILKLKTEQERKISRVKFESDKKLADKFYDLNKLLSQQMDQQEKLEMQREKIESQLKHEFENTRERFQLEIAKLQTTLKTKEMEEQILRERCEILSQEIEKTQDHKWKKLIDKTYNISNQQKMSPEMLFTSQCITPEPSPTLEKNDSAVSKYQYNVQKLRNELDKTITQNIIAALGDENLTSEELSKED